MGLETGLSIVNDMSLLHKCMVELVLNTKMLQQILPHLPSAIHIKLFTEAAILFPRCDRAVMRGSILALVSTWPTEKFSMRDLLPSQYIRLALNSGTQSTLLSVIVEGLLNIQSCCKITTVDFRGVYSSALFELPVLSLSEQLRNPDDVLKLLKHKCGGFLGASEEEDLFSVLTWKVTDLTQRNTGTQISINNPIQVLTELRLNLSDFLAISTELLGLSLYKQSTFHLKVTSITVDNYHHNQANNFRGFLNIIHKSGVEKLVVYGVRRGINQLMWDISSELQQLNNLNYFGLGTHGPKMHLPSLGEPSMDEIFTRASLSFSRWTHLTQVYFIGIVLKKQISKLLGSLKAPLLSIILHGCDLDADDIVYLSTSHHVPHLQELDLQCNNFHNRGEILCNLVERAGNLCMLNLTETQLNQSEKIALMRSLCVNVTKLHTLVMYEKEDMLTAEGYETVVGLACLMESLTEFYIFPLDYAPFELLCREEGLEERSRQILGLKERTNLELFY